MTAHRESTLHRDPSAAELVASVREFLTERVMAETDGALRFHSRVAANVLAIVERELTDGPGQELAHADRLATIGFTDDAELAAAIRTGQLDDRFDEILEALRPGIDAKVAVTNPRWGTE